MDLGYNCRKEESAPTGIWYVLHTCKFWPDWGSYLFPSDDVAPSWDVTLMLYISGTVTMERMLTFILGACRGFFSNLLGWHSSFHFLFVKCIISPLVTKQVIIGVTIHVYYCWINCLRQRNLTLKCTFGHWQKSCFLMMGLQSQMLQIGSVALCIMASFFFIVGALFFLVDGASFFFKGVALLSICGWTLKLVFGAIASFSFTDNASFFFIEGCTLSSIKLLNLLCVVRLNKGISTCLGAVW